MVVPIIFLTSLTIERGLTLFSYFHKRMGKPITTNLVTVRPVESHHPEHLANLKRIFDDRIISDEYWTNSESIDNPYLDFEIHYHSFVPTHVEINNAEATRPLKLKVFCGRYYDSMKEILNIDNPSARGIYPIDTSLYDGEVCKFFRYQMVGLNIKDGKYFDVRDFDMYGDIYGVDGIYPCTFKDTQLNPQIVFSCLVESD